jgi:hypothetical protein
VEVGVSWYEVFDKPHATSLVKITGTMRGHDFELLGMDVD